MTEKIGVVITGGDFQALGALRTLAGKGVPVILLDNDRFIGKYSRYRKRFFKSPKLCEEVEYVNFLIDLAGKERIHGWVILPNSDEAVYLLSKNRDILSEYYRVPTPHWDVIKNIHIKKNTYQMAEKIGIPVPRTYYPHSLKELIDLDLPFPLVIKPSIRDNFYNKVKVKAFKIDNREQLIKTYGFVCSVIDPAEVLVQEFIPGGANQLYSYCPFFKDNKTVCGVAAKRTRQHPMDFGHATTFAQVVDIPEIRNIADTFLRSVGYYGIAEVEFMKEKHNGEFKLIEVNPRIWGWHSLAIGAGIDLPYLLYQDMIGQKIETPPAPKHVKWVRLTTDVPTAIMEILKGNLKIMDYISSMQGKKEFAVLRFNDPLPFLIEVAMIPYLFRKRGF